MGLCPTELSWGLFINALQPHLSTQDTECEALMEWMNQTEWMNHIALAANTMQDSSWKPLRQSYRQGVDGSQRLKLELEWMEVSIVPPGIWVTLGTWTSLYFSVLKYKADTIMAPATKGRCEWLSVSVLAWTHISGLRSIRTTYLQERVQLTRYKNAASVVPLL